MFTTRSKHTARTAYRLTSAVAVALAFAGTSQADLIEWDGEPDPAGSVDNTGTTQLWTNGDNWVGDAAPSSTDDVQVKEYDGDGPGGTNPDVTVDLDGDKTVNSLELGSGARNTLQLGTTPSGETLTVTNGQVNVTSKGSTNINSDLELGVGASIRDTANIDSQTINGNISGIGGAAVDLQIGSSGSQDTITVNGNITANNLTIGLAGDDGGARLNGNNTVTGNVTVNGELTLGSANATGGAAGTVNSGGRVTFADGAQGSDLSLFSFSTGSVLEIDEDPGANTVAPFMAADSAITVGRTSVDGAFDVNFGGNLRVDGESFGGGGDYDGDLVLDDSATGDNVLYLENRRHQSGTATYDGLISDGGQGDATLAVHLVGQGGRIELTNTGNSFSGNSPGIVITRGTLVVNEAGTLGSGDIEVTPADEVTAIQEGPDGELDRSLTDNVANLELNAADLLNDDITLFLNSAVVDETTIYGTVDLNFTGTDTIAGLVIDGVDQGLGTFDASTHPDFLVGDGALQVIPEPASLAMLAAGGLLMLRRRNGRQSA
ncbi:MAG: PEP-CTERM sorting domain-containing protein [Phycisphaeraceae bacterium]